MQKVEAYQDQTGRLHKHKRDAVLCDFGEMVADAWGSMPIFEGKGDPKAIAEIIASTTYPMVRVRLREALDYLDEQLKD